MDGETNGRVQSIAYALFYDAADGVAISALRTSSTPLKNGRVSHVQVINTAASEVALHNIIMS